MEKVVETLLEVARDEPKVLDDPAAEVIFSGFGESSLDLELAVWFDVRESGPGPVKSALNYRIEAALSAAGIEIPFPQRDVHFRTGTVTVASKT